MYLRHIVHRSHVKADKIAPRVFKCDSDECGLSLTRCADDRSWPGPQAYQKIKVLPSGDHVGFCFLQSDQLDQQDWRAKPVLDYDAPIPELHCELARKGCWCSDNAGCRDSCGCPQSFEAESLAYYAWINHLAGHKLFLPGP